MRKLVVLFMAAGLALLVYSQDKSKFDESKEAPDGESLSGAVLYRTYCAVCHGLDGRGNGPAAPVLKPAVPDLTLLSKRNHGEFPWFRVETIIQADGEPILAHGTREMPMWGDVFREIKRDEVYVKLRVHNLAQYIASLER